MSYFNRFPLLAYAANNNAVVNIVSDVLRRVTVDKKTKENLVIFDEYDIQDGETPELVSYKFYDTTDYHWVILIVNDILDPRFAWPLTDEQLYTYTANKYGTANVNATKHYVVSEGSDIVVDPTQNVITKTVQILNNFPDNIDYLFDYAANGTIDLTLTDSQRELIVFLQNTTTELLPGTVGIRRGDADHSLLFTNSPSVSFTTSDADAFQKVINGQEIAIDPAGESLNSNLLRSYMQRPVDLFFENPAATSNFGNVTWLNGLGIVTISETYNPLKHYKGPSGNLYTFTPTITANVTFLASGGIVTSGSGRTIESFLQTQAFYSSLFPGRGGQAVFYLKGDITRSTFLSGRTGGSSLNDGVVALTFQQGNLSSSSPFYVTTVNLLAELNANAFLKLSLSNNLIAIPGQETSLAYPNAYPITNIAYESEINETKRRIRVLKNEYISAFVTEFERLVNG
jgi:hypothetical protein